MDWRIPARIWLKLTPRHLGGYGPQFESLTIANPSATSVERKSTLPGPAPTFPQFATRSAKEIKPCRKMTFSDLAWTNKG